MNKKQAVVTAKRCNLLRTRYEESLLIGTPPIDFVAGKGDNGVARRWRHSYKMIAQWDPQLVWASQSNRVDKIIHKCKF